VTQAAVPIAISGKRRLDGEDELVRRALARAFDVLDAELPGAAKVLLTGLAVGADTLAAEQALGRPDWTATAVLPLARALYLDDFPAAPRRRLEALLADPRVGLREMAPLRDPATGAPAGAEALRQPPQGSNPLRDRHYEQQGLWLADNAALLIAVKPADEQPGLIGGTARIVAYRLSGKPDRAARAVIAASSELGATSPAAELHGGPVWLIDAPRPDATARRRDRPFQVLLPRGGDAPPAPRRFAERVRLSLLPARRLVAPVSRLAGSRPR
jgi:hypothetical protein